ncbi:MAG: hypothetical protein QXX30_04715 [Candidatus Aenigmatarchaeota archaeon]
MEALYLPRALILKEPDAKKLYWSFLNAYNKEFGRRLFELDDEEVLIDLKLFFKAKFEELLDDVDVDEVVVLIGERAYEIWDADTFLDVLAKKVLREKSIRGMLLSGLEFLKRVKLPRER